MDEREQEILDRIKQQTRQEAVPESLHPENIEKLLATKVKKRRKFRPAYMYSLTAACLLLVFAGLGYGYSVNENMIDKESALSEESLTVDSYDQLYAYFERYQEYGDGESVLEFDADKSTPSESANYTSSGDQHSTTNVREKGVGEADIVLTDGKYLYVLAENDNEIKIIDTTGKKMKEKGNIKPEKNKYIFEFYLQDEQLIVIYSKADSIYASSGKMQTEAVVYNVEKPNDIKEVGKVSQSGDYETSRLVDDYLYLFTSYYVDSDDMNKKDHSTYVPTINDELIPLECIVYPTVPRADQYIVISSIHINKPNQVIDQQAILSNDGLLYVSGQNIYMTEYVNDDKEAYVQTSIQKVSYEKGKLRKEKTGKVYGYLEDSFSIDEYDGHLRLVTTVEPTYEYSWWSRGVINEDDGSNALYVLDEKLSIVGRIEGLAPGERVYSARFMGDMSYFVTFREVDPLFSVDLSNPHAPKIIGELKIPGFSEYLHPYLDGKLLGIGMDADEKTGQTSDVKLSMFDISDPTNVEEVHKHNLLGAYDSSAFYDYKSVLIDGRKNIIGFSVDANAYNSIRKYYIFEYGKDGFVNRLEVHRSTEGRGEIRGLYIGEKLYIVDEVGVISYNLNTYEEVERATYKQLQ